MTKVRHFLRLVTLLKGESLVVFFCGGGGGWGWVLREKEVRVEKGVRKKQLVYLRFFIVRGTLL